MAATGHPEYYNLSQYTDDDHPTYTGDYNEDVPSATGLTAAQLDTQYSDDYNIVRVGAPARSNESEESSP